ncbi:hypothetical protein WDW89_18005 [Deltaproteobacteria bacterium TL4]
MANLKSLKDLVQNAIDKGATTVEEVHKQIANMPLDTLEKISGFEAKAKSIKKVQDSSIGSVYDTIRSVNQKVGELASKLLDKVEKK